MHIRISLKCTSIDLTRMECKGIKALRDAYICKGIDLTRMECKVERNKPKCW